MNPLLDNQKSAKEYLQKYKVGALFMEMGTGKTRVTCELVNSAKDIDSIFWIAPLRTLYPLNEMDSVIDEINKWGGFNVPVYYFGIESIQGSDRIYLDLINKIGKSKNPFIIIDESITIKNSTAKRTKRIIEISKIAEYKLILNGTPLSKNLMDLKPQLDFLSPLILNMSDEEYKNTFCKYTKITKIFKGKHKYCKEFITGYENIDYLYSIIKNYVFECGVNLSVNQYYNNLNYFIDGVLLKEYYRLKELYLDNEMLLMKNNNIFLEMTQKMQRSYCCSQSKIDLLNELFKQKDESKFIIFCKYIDSRNLCKKHFKKATILSYQTGSFGLNLQHLNNTIYFDKVWDLSVKLQASKRTFRTGQEYDCTYYDLTGDVGLESLIDKNITKKIGMLEYFKSKTKQELINEL